VALRAARTRGLVALLICAISLLAAASAHAAPTAGAPPSIAGKAIDGKRMKASTGSWSGGKPFSYSYVWKRCDASGAGCAPIEGAATSRYTPSAADVGHRLVVVVKATDGEGSGEATSGPSGVVAPAPPRHKGAAPAIVGNAQDGQVLSATNGGWTGTGPLAFAYQWQSCAGSSCASIGGATASSYRPAGEQLGHKLRVLVTASNGGGSASRASKKTAAIVPGPPVDTALPTVSGLPVVEQKLSAETGTWAGTGPFTYTYQWRGCNLAGVCEDISGAHEPTYTVGPLQIANSIEVVVTAHNALGESSATSEPTDLITALLPKNLGLPSIAGLLQDGGLLSALTGSWEGSEPLGFSYAWELCDAAGLECEQLKGALGSTLGLLSSAVGSTVRVIVTATNSAGSTSATSEPTSLVKALLPSNSGLPSITGLLQDGSLLSALTGSWTGTGPLGYAFQWEKCNSAGAECEPISGETGSTLKLLTGLIGSTVRVAVTATNSGGSSTVTSPATDLIKALLPSNAGLPSITGLLEDGGLLTAFNGTWTGSGPLDFTYAWELCNAAGAACAPIEGALGSTLSLVSGFVGHTVRLAVTAANGAGSQTAYSEPTSLVGALLPSNTGLPSITGLLQDGSSLTGLLGSWKGTAPLSYALQWQRCSATGGECEDIKGATSSTLGLVESLVGGTVRLLVTATNGAGSTTAASQPTSLVKALLPSNTGLPSIAGLLQDGSSLNGLLGSWTGTGPLSYSYQWLLCNAAGEGCKEVSGATGSTLGLLTGMIGSTVRLAVTASNAAGSSTATSEPSSLVKALLPSNSGLPSIAGLLQDGSLLSAAKGSWGGSEPVSYGYQWLLCNAAGEGCKEVSGASGSTLGLLTSMIGSTARVVVTATNAAGSVSATSAPTGLVKALLPSNTGLPSIVGSLIDGSTLTGAKGSWTGSEPGFSYQWLQCNAAGEGCKEVAGATSSTLGLLTGMIGGTVRLAVTATNGAGSTTATSEPSGLIKALLPSNTGLPSIGGLLEDGQTLTGAKGSWTGSEPSFSYQWLLCNGGGSECSEISKATGGTLSLLTSEIGKTVRLAVTATNAAGSSTATSAPSSAILAMLPKIVSLPSIGGLLEDGQTLTGSKGSWEGSEPGYSYQWQLCSAAGTECKEISGATGTTLGLLTSEIGKTVRLAVTASNARGSSTAYSNPSSAILAILPKALSLPSIAGLAEDGQTLTEAKGSWEGSEPAFTYQWKSCNAGGGSCESISKATATTFGLTEGLIGRTLRLAVTATNSRGSVTAESAATSGVLAILPFKAAAPSIAGILQVGKVLEVLPNGEWGGSEKPKVSWQWQTCGLLGKESECKNIATAIKNTLELKLEWVGLTLRVVESATNSRGTVTKASPITSTILGLILTPNKGSTEGGTAVKLAAPGVGKASAVRFGAAKTTEIEVDSPNEITVSSPAASTEGTVPVTVSTPEGTTHETPETQFTYTEP
jgi:hypothetical protein